MPDGASALQLVFGGDPALYAIVALSLYVSLCAVVLAALVALPLGAFLALVKFPGRGLVVVVTNAFMGLPPVVVGLVVYLLLSRSGPLGPLGILFTPTAMVIAQALLGLPIVAALTHRSLDELWLRYGDALRMDGASRLRAGSELLRMAPGPLLTAFLAGFGRAIAEVGAILVVGGNIRGVTRTMTTAIALETSKGDLALALALGLILIVLSVVVTAVTFWLNRRIGGR